MSSRPPAVLILTHEGDHYTIDRVGEALERRGARPFRLNTDLFPSNLRLSALREGALEHRWIEGEGGALDGHEVAAVWLRRLWTPRLDDQLDPRFREGCRREISAALAAILDGFAAARWVNPREAERTACNKGRQLREAAALGLRVPRTLLTNDPDRVRAFHAVLEGRMVSKMLTPLSVSMEKTAFFVPTREVLAEDLEHLDGLRHSPMVFQENVPKRRELRIAVVERRMFAGAIDTRRTRAGRTDWREADPSEVAWEPADVPLEVASRILGLMEALGLVYGAVDLIETPDGEHVFLEVNPGGEWGMLERDLGLPISDALAEALVGTGT